MPSFDIVSEVNLQEVDNAINQAQREVQARYDFKGSKFQIHWDKKELYFTAEDDYKMGAIKDNLQSKLHKRGIDIKAIKFEKIEQIGGQMLKQKVTIVQGIETEIAKKIVKIIKDSKIKVQAAIHEEKVKVTSKSIDSLQETIALVKQAGIEIPLQYNNMRS